MDKTQDEHRLKDGEVQVGGNAENIMKVPQKLKIELSYDPAIPLWVCIRRNSKHKFKEYIYSYVNCSLIHNRQTMEAIQVPINR